MAAAKNEGPAGRPTPLENTLNDTASFADLDASRKAFTTLAARLALRGFGLYELACGGYLVARWDLSRHCSDLGQVAAFAKTVGVPS